MSKTPPPPSLPNCLVVYMHIKLLEDLPVYVCHADFTEHEDDAVVGLPAVLCGFLQPLAWRHEGPIVGVSVVEERM
jgi:hypothetical protein